MKTERAKSPVVAGLLSGIFPGLGQFYCRAWAKGLACLGATALVDATAGVSAGLLEFATKGVLPASPGPLLIGSALMMVIAAWSVLDAIRTARRLGA